MHTTHLYLLKENVYSEQMTDTDEYTSPVHDFCRLFNEIMADVSNIGDMIVYLILQGHLIMYFYDIECQYIAWL